VKIILDENLPARWIHFLAPRGFVAQHWTTIGNAGDPDERILDHAAKTESVIITQDLDFTRIIALRGATVPSLIQLRVSCPTPEVVDPSLVQILQDYNHAILQGCLITLDANHHRIRLLPLRE